MTDLYVSQDKHKQAHAHPASSAHGPQEKSVTEGVTAGQHDQVRTHINDVLKRVGEKPRKELGGAYTVFPGVKFIQKQQDEEVVLMLRAHPITNFKWIVTVILALLLPEILIAFGALAEIPFRVVFVGRLVWYLMMLGFSFEKFLSWYYSVFIVTNERVIDIDFVNLLYRVVSYANLDHIEEPAMVAGGFIRSIFKYGDVSVATAAEKSTIEAMGVPHPDKVIRIVSELAEDYERAHGRRDK